MERLVYKFEYEYTKKIIVTSIVEHFIYFTSVTWLSAKTLKKVDNKTIFKVKHKAIKIISERSVL